ncbi:MAG: DNA polymerase I, partial [Patescibacteria group bacterium]|nr:DNA polymerase I [Patescibacteria group bacterium]
MKKLLVIDGNAIVHRAYHAYPPSLTTPLGEPINAVYGWFAMLIKVLEEVKPEYLAVCFDRPAPTFRKQLYAGYQAHRPQMADDLSLQITKLQDALTNIGIPLFGIDGYEADDLIGTISVEARKQGVETIILS